MHVVQRLLINVTNGVAGNGFALTLMIVTSFSDMKNRYLCYVDTHPANFSIEKFILVNSCSNIKSDSVYKFRSVSTSSTSRKGVIPHHTQFIKIFTNSTTPQPLHYYKNSHSVVQPTPPLTQTPQQQTPTPSFFFSFTLTNSWHFRQFYINTCEFGFSTFLSNGCNNAEIGTETPSLIASNGKVL
jgi:hypothetical protein